MIISGKLQDANFNGAKIAHIYRVVREVLANILKHADATTITLSFEQGERKISISITDNGKGFDPHAAGKGHGLANIRTRVALLDGKLVLETAPAKGTSYQITIPKASLTLTDGTKTQDKSTDR